MLENASFVHVFGCMCMLELTITGWWIIVTYLSTPNWFELQLVSQLASYLFSYFLLRSLLPFSNSKFFLISCIIICLRNSVSFILLIKLFLKGWKNVNGLHSQNLGTATTQCSAINKDHKLGMPYFEDGIFLYIGY